MSYLVAEVKDPYALSHEDSPLRFGSYVTADIIGMSVESASVIPSYLINEGKVPLLDSELKLRFVKVDVIRHDGANAIIGNGLSQGDRLITSALDYPLDGMALALPSQDVESENEQSGETQVASIRE